MKRFLIRSGISPLDVKSPEEIIAKNSIGGNVGNLIYAYSVYRTLTTEDVTFVPDNYRINPSDADKINKEYDCYIIPLADAFRPDFVSSLRKYAKLIKKLTIPVIVIGVGLRAPFEPKLNEGFPFDDDVKAFVSAVLEKSSIIGVRGQITADYLTRLGFKEGKDHMVIGCPSMYAFGPELNIRDTTITKDSLIGVNSSKLSPDNVLDFIQRSTEEFPNYYFIPQWLTEMKLTYLGNAKIKATSAYYPNDLSHKFYQEGRVKFPLNAPKWIDFLKEADLVFGARLHGNITAVIAGTPSILIPKDARMRELTEFHDLTHIWANEITAETKLADVIEQVDFKSPEKSHAAHFENYIEFLNKNELDHIYKSGNYPASVPLDDQLAKLDLLEPVDAITRLSMAEAGERWVEHQSYVDKIMKEKDQKIKDLNATINKKNKKLCKHEGTLNRKAVKLALNIADRFSSK